MLLGLDVTTLDGPYCSGLAHFLRESLSVSRTRPCRYELWQSSWKNLLTSRVKQPLNTRWVQLVSSGRRAREINLRSLATDKKRAQLALEETARLRQRVVWISTKKVRNWCRVAVKGVVFFWSSRNHLQASASRKLQRIGDLLTLRISNILHKAKYWVLQLSQS